jgi:hypothetical protein
MTEIWRDIRGFPTYQVSSFGRIRRVKGKPRILKGAFIKGSWCVFLYNSEGVKKFNVISRIILTAFVRPPEEGEIARHLDDNPHNQVLGNLSWGTYQDNAEDSRINKRMIIGSNHSKSKLNETQVSEILISYIRGKTGTVKLAKKYGVVPSTINAIVNRKTWKHVVV